MSIIEKVVSDSAFTAVRSVASMVKGLAVIPLITNLLGAESYGVWVTVFAIVSLLSSTGGMHLHGSLIRYASDDTGHNQAYSDILCLTTVVGVVLAVGVGLLGIAVDLSVLLGTAVSDQSTLVIVCSVLVFAEILYRVNSNFPRAKGYVKQYELVMLSRDLLGTVVLVSVFLAGGGILAGVTGLAGLLIALNVVLVSAVAVKFPLPTPDISNFARHVRYGVPMIPNALSSKLLAHTDKYLLLYFLGPSAVGIYAVAQKICMPLQRLTSVFNSTLYPTIASAWDEGNHSEITSVYAVIYRYYSIIGIPAAVGVVLLSEPFITVLSTSQIAAEGLHLVPLFAVGYFTKGYDTTIRYVLTAAEQTDRIGLSVLGSALVNIVLNVTLIPMLGMAGAAVATVASYVFLFGVILYYSLSEITLVIPTATIGRSLLAAGVMAATLLTVDPEFGVYRTLLVVPLFGAAIYFAVLLLIGEFDKPELRRATTTLKEMI